MDENVLLGRKSGCSLLFILSGITGLYSSVPVFDNGCIFAQFLFYLFFFEEKNVNILPVALSQLLLDLNFFSNI